MQKAVSNYLSKSGTARMLITILAFMCIAGLAALMIGDMVHAIGKAICFANNAGLALTKCQ